MKKFIIALVILSALGLSSCNTKDCRCYELVGGRWTGPRTNITSAGTPCSSLNNRTVVCNEMEDPILNPDDIGVDSKRKQPAS